MMRNPLSRRMFTSPQQRRQMSLMPAGILASGPNVMRAANVAFSDLAGGSATGIRPNQSMPEAIVPDAMQNSSLGDLIVGTTTPVPVQESADVGADVASSSTIDDRRTNASTLGTFTSAAGEVRPDLNLTSRKNRTQQ